MSLPKINGRTATLAVLFSFLVLAQSLYIKLAEVGRFSSGVDRIDFEPPSKIGK